MNPSAQSKIQFPVTVLSGVIPIGSLARKISYSAVTPPWRTSLFHFSIERIRQFVTLAVHSITQWESYYIIGWWDYWEDTVKRISKSPNLVIMICLWWPLLRGHPYILVKHWLSFQDEVLSHMQLKSYLEKSYLLHFPLLRDISLFKQTIYYIIGWFYYTIGKLLHYRLILLHDWLSYYIIGWCNYWVFLSREHWLFQTCSWHRIIMTSAE